MGCISYLVFVFYSLFGFMGMDLAMVAVDAAGGGGGGVVGF